MVIGYIQYTLIVQLALWWLLESVILYSGKVWWIYSSIVWWKKVWQINRSLNRLLIVSTNLDGFSLLNHSRFSKFAKISSCQTFLLYNIYKCCSWFLVICNHSQNHQKLWPDLRKDAFHAHSSKTHFSQSNDSCIID